MLGVVVTGRGEPNGKAHSGSQAGSTAEVKRSDDIALFDLWLERSLREAFEEVSREPIPPELIALIESHRRKS